MLACMLLYTYMFPFCSPDASETKCYIHSVSPVKKFGNTSYFNCNLQTETDVYRSVCFALEKKETLEAMAQQRSPVKITKHTISSKCGREDVVIDKNSTITATNTDFEYKSEEDVTSISSMAHVTPEQLVAIKGYLTYLSGTKKVIIKGSDLKKQEGYISNPSGYIKIIFWGNHTDEVQQGSTYFFNKVRVKTNQNQKYLNTPRQESECTIELAEPFTEPLPALDEVSTTKEITANILGISSINKYNPDVTVQRKLPSKASWHFARTVRCPKNQILAMYSGASNCTFKTALNQSRSFIFMSMVNRW